MMDLDALFQLTYGLYVVCSKDGEQKSGCIVNTVTQATAEPVRVSVAISKDNFTTELIGKTGLFTVSVLPQDVPPTYIGTFGFRHGKDLDKFAAVPYGEDQAGIPYLSEHSLARLSCKTVGQVDLQTHVLFIAEVTEAENLQTGEPLTYSYYRNVKRGTVPKTAPTYHAPEKKA